ncbi:trypsin-like peptidase domain-containing protein [Pseudobacteriovorax antillogorgiicola]|uniref:Serine protease Do n=1 Tax=Pseudobacteriovorax antillogorgiicola TaxID=1513793 RepID=A0A1Y6B9X3_9BACT|nr:trypsin-like peptidase domain-containing protein [Pseudobacteriovorax antillogorgiicola]TCS58604.1 serine protease Do [Pseudobacteriovorax antillogorgiicola]SME96949.1 serine protease Do [Pseudobacteriovorax antillogorgiicola]
MHLVIVLISIIFATDSYGRIYQSFADIAERAIPGVVNIRTTQYVAGRDALLDPYQFFLNGRLPRGAKTHSLGSGVIMKQSGYVITNYHVVDGAAKIDVLFAKTKKKVRAKLVGADQKTDLALLKIHQRGEARPLDFGDSDRLRVGDIVLAIGNPFGFAHTVTSGIISAKGRVIGTGPYDRFLQTDAPIHPGNSGGPLIDIRGRVIGVNTAVSAQGAGIGFAIPSNLVQSVVKDLIRHGKVIRPWLGIVGKNILAQDELGDNYDPSGVYGVIVENLIVEGPAYRAGLRIGDLIMAMDGKKIFDLNQLQRFLSQKAPASRVTLKIYRRRTGFVNLTVALSEIPATQELPQEKDLF